MRMSVLLLRGAYHSAPPFRAASCEHDDHLRLAQGCPKRRRGMTMPSSSDEVKGAQTLTKADSFATLKLNRATPRYTAAAVAVSDQAELSTCYAVGWCDGRTAK